MSNTNNEINKRNRADVVKMIVALVLLFALCAALVAVGLNLFGVFDKAPDVLVPDVIENDIAPLLGNVETESGVSISQAVASAENPSTYSVTATVLPKNAAQLVEWSANWTNPSSEWANGKDVNDYIRLTSVATRADITYLQGFGEQITIVTRASQDREKYAELRVDCRGDYSINNILGTFSFASGKVFEGGTCTFKVNENIVGSLPLDNLSLKVTFDFSYLLFDGNINAGDEINKRLPGILDSACKILEPITLNCDVVGREGNAIVFSAKTDCRFPFEFSRKIYNGIDSIEYYWSANIIQDNNNFAWLQLLFGGAYVDYAGSSYLDELRDVFYRISPITTKSPFVASTERSYEASKCFKFSAVFKSNSPKGEDSKEIGVGFGFEEGTEIIFGK